LAGGIRRPQVHPNHILEQPIAAQNTRRFDYLEAYPLYFSTQRQNSTSPRFGLIQPRRLLIPRWSIELGRPDLKRRAEFTGNALRENSIRRLSPPCRDPQTPPPSYTVSFHQHRSVLPNRRLYATSISPVPLPHFLVQP